MARLLELQELPLARSDAARSDNAAPSATAADDFPPLITAMPINAAQQKIAFAVALPILLVEFVSAPFARMPVAHVDGFIPALQSALCIVNLLTALLLFSQYAVRPRWANLAIAAGYLFSALFAFEQALAFPGAFAAAGVLGGGRDAAAWLFVLWHTSFPVMVIIYALSRDAERADQHFNPRPSINIAITIALVLATTALLTLAVTTGSAHLPRIFVGADEVTETATALQMFLWLLNSAAIALLWLRRRTILDLWLVVTLFAWWPNFFVGTFVMVIRFSIGWYVARCLAVIASSALLFVLLAEVTVLYSRLASAMQLLRRERANRLMSAEAASAAMAHEIRQPLAGISSFATAGLTWLKRTPPAVEKIEGCLSSIINTARGAEQIIAGIRGVFKKMPDQRMLVDINELCREVMRLVQHDVLSNGVAMTFEGQKGLPPILMDHTQVQQVILNLLRNAIEAMNSRPMRQRRLRLATRFDAKNCTVFLTVQDSGAGVAVEPRDRIFEPFFTTKPAGMGLGLSICRTIVEQHGGTLRLVGTGSHGSTFEMAMPIAAEENSPEAPLKP